MESFEVMKKFEIPHKRPPLEKLEQWREHAFVLNKSRRFRFCANVQKRREMEEWRKLKAGIMVVTAANKFVEVLSIEPRGTEGATEAHKYDFNSPCVCVEGIQHDGKLCLLLETWWSKW